MAAQKALDSQINPARGERHWSSTIPDFLLHYRDKDYCAGKETETQVKGIE